jgi:hypothetical protein
MWTDLDTSKRQKGRTRRRQGASGECSTSRPPSSRLFFLTKERRDSDGQSRSEGLSRDSVAHL